jgi:diadenylate cyclase
MNPLLRNLLSAIRLADVVDILLLAAVLFVGITWLRRSSSRGAARRLVAMAVVFALVYVLVDTLDLYLMERLLRVLAIGVLIAGVMVFQADVRRLLDRIASWSLFRRAADATPPSPVETLVETAARLADERIGALIAIRGREPWESHVQGGVELGGKVSRPLLQSIFQPDSPGHDGAVLMEGDRVTRFAVHLPLSNHLPEVSRFGGTRHAAALGLAEESDALVVVVSEERGTISIAEDGTLEEMSSASELGRRLERFWNAHYAEGPSGSGGWWSRRTVESAGLSLALAASAWLVFSYSGDTVFRTYEAPIEFRNLPAGWSLERDTTLTARVTLAGSEQAFRRLDPAQLAVSFDLERPVAGENELLITEEQLSLPSGLHLSDANPRELTVAITRRVEARLPVRVRTLGVLPDSLALQARPDTVSVTLSGALAELPDHVATEPLDLSQIPRGGRMRVRLALPPGAQLRGEQREEIEVQVMRRPDGPRSGRPQPFPRAPPRRRGRPSSGTRRFRTERRCASSQSTGTCGWGRGRPRRGLLRQRRRNRGGGPLRGARQLREWRHPDLHGGGPVQRLHRQRHHPLAPAVTTPGSKVQVPSSGARTSAGCPGPMTCD